MRARDGLEPSNAFKLTLKRPIIISKIPPPHDLYGTIFAEGIASQPYFTLRTDPDATNQFVVRNSYSGERLCGRP